MSDEIDHWMSLEEIRAWRARVPVDRDTRGASTAVAIEIAELHRLLDMGEKFIELLVDLGSVMDSEHAHQIALDWHCHMDSSVFDGHPTMEHRRLYAALKREWDRHALTRASEKKRLSEIHPMSRVRELMQDWDKANPKPTMAMLRAQQDKERA